mmetsp:Transcript_15973/g.33520  ORF Transcript_15973/g.33520 Transcript_15973/m.33520 type:complete len:303 (+) Transcript_15973:904-1812(+)
MIVRFKNNETNESENWSPRELASLIAKRQSSGEDARCLIAPLPIELHPDDGSLNSHTATRRTSSSKVVKNPFKANRQALKERQKSNKNAALDKRQREENEKRKILQKKEKMFGNIKSKVHEPIASSLYSANTPKEHLVTSLSRNRVSKTSSEKDLNNACHIAFGSKVSSVLNATRTSVTSMSPQQNEPAERHKSYGKIPAYIINRREKIERQEQERKMLQEKAPPAPGLVLMAESERLETLRLLEENEEKERHALQNIPFSMNGHRAARLRDVIEFRLKEIEDAKKIFSNPRVFVSENKDDN